MVRDIVLVEDNPTDVELILDSLRTHGLSERVDVLRDGQEALEYFAGTGKYAGRDVCALPKVILLDLKLPKVDGIEVLRSIRADQRTRTVPVVILTSSNEYRDRELGYQLGANSYIVKPIDFDTFSETVAQIGLYWVSMNSVPEGGACG